MDEKKIKDAMKRKAKFVSLRIGQIKEMEEQYPDDGKMARTYERMAYSFATILTNSGIETTMEDIYELPSSHPLITKLTDALGDSVPGGNSGGETSISSALNDGDGPPQK